MIPYGRQSISEDDIDAVTRVLRSDWLTQGPAVEHFESSVAEYCGARYSVAVCNATSALHLACKALGLGHGDILWTSPITFVASANCALYCGADVDFVDIDPNTYNMSAELLEAKLREAHKAGRLPKVIVPVHFAGQSCAMEEIARLAKQYGVSVIEDASHAIGGRYKESRVGSCSYSDLTVFSFHPVKIITTGEGGIALTNREDIYEILLSLRSHGITRNPELMEGESHGSWYYQQTELGYNYRMTDIQAALGTSQMKSLDEFVARRRVLADRYSKQFKGLPLTLPWQHPDTFSPFHLYVIRLRREEINKTHRKVFESLRGAGIGVNIHYIPVHTQPYYARLGFKTGAFPESEKYYSEAISLPLFSGMTDEEQKQVIRAVRATLQ